MKIMASFMGFLVLLILLPAPAQAEPVGRFTYIEGRVDITPPGQIASPAYLGYEVHVGDIIRTKSRAKAEITFADATVMRLSQGSRVEISDYMIGKGKRRGVIRLFRGKIRSVVSKFLRMASFSSRNRYEVHTPTAVAGVRGTDFFVFYQRGVSGAVFKEGLGYVYSRNRPLEIREIVAGQAMLVMSADQPPAIRSFSSIEIQKHLNDTEPLEKHERKAEEKDKSTVIAEETLPETGTGTQGDLASAQETEASEPIQSEDLPSQTSSPEVVASLEPDTTPDEPHATATDTGIPDNTPAPDDPFSDTTAPETTPAPETTVPDVNPEPVIVSPDISPEPVIVSPEITPEPVIVSPEITPEPVIVSPDITPEPVIVSPDISPEPVIVSPDITAPAISITNAPDSITNSHSADFEVSSDEEVTYSYLLDDEEVDTTCFTDLDEGDHTFTVTATDEAGNASKETYTWTTDYTSPVIAPPDSPQLDLDSHTVSFSLSCDESVTYSYTIDGADTDTLDFENLAEDEHVLTYTATDLAGNTSSGTLTFGLALYELTDSGTEPIKVKTSDCTSVYVDDQRWGTWGSMLNGTYEGSPSNDWALHLSDEGGNQHQWVEVVGTSWSDNELSGKAPGAWVDWEKAITGVCGGELNGTFDATTWQADVMGGWVETEKFLKLAATEAGRVQLSELNVPCIEIGKANLDGGNKILNVHMKNVTFFAYSTGTDPRIWATNEVQGEYYSIPTNGCSVTLSGDELKVDFTVNTWDNGIWGANVIGKGNYNGSTIQMNGGAAGTYTGSSSGDFTGTGAGVVR